MSRDIQTGDSRKFSFWVPNNNAKHDKMRRLEITR